LLADLELRDLVSMHFVWAIGKPKGTGMRIGMGKAKVLRHAQRCPIPICCRFIWPSTWR
jgi:hypothetical protein